MKCDLCPEPAVAFLPGSEGERHLFLLRREVPRRQWCAACWPFLKERAA